MLPHCSGSKIACYVSIVKVLLDYKADTNLCNKYGTSALHVASGNGHAAVIELLLARSAQINVIESLPFTRIADHLLTLSC